MTKSAVTAGQMILDGFNIENLQKKRERRRSDAAGEIPLFCRTQGTIAGLCGGLLPANEQFLPRLFRLR